MDPKKLIAVATGEIAHANAGLCPDMVAGYDSRDPECLACRIIVEAERAMQETRFWYRPHSDGQGYDGPIHDSQIEPVRRKSGAWVPLYAVDAQTADHPEHALELVGLRGEDQPAEAGG